jgi:hypothetical protein
VQNDNAADSYVCGVSVDNGMLLEFDNSHKVFLAEHTGKVWEIVVKRCLRTDQFPDMQQPVPFGAMLGFDGTLSIKRDGLPAVRAWKLFREGVLVAEGTTDGTGLSRGLPIDMPYLPIVNYTLEII